VPPPNRPFLSYSPLKELYIFLYTTSICLLHVVRRAAADLFARYQGADVQTLLSRGGWFSTFRSVGDL